ncbi:FIVAR domain-containing protein [Lactobacillus kefiranofaciens]|uniref:FIVAR domain-containing protein n=1 Tax=Lactobacillus kefiranofaciens TaxID=267818 RepID=UPI00246987C4|nr:FIVAR domain-containing protein [Lactobacillus kefiranofaciens]MDH5100597.1 FIVAR domain-containing protein [Lactobacillus kefiranofaciens]
MKIKQIALTATAAVLLASPALAVIPNSAPVFATTTNKKTKQTITVANSDNVILYDTKGKRLVQNDKYKRPITLKSGSTITYYGKPKLIKGPKIYYYTNRTDPLTPKWLPYYKTIKGKKYVYLGKGEYAKATNVSIYPLHRHIYTYLNKTPIYNKNGKKIKTVKRGKKYVFPAKFNKKFNQYHYEPKFFFNIGKGRYVTAADVSQINGKDVLFTNLNSYVYTKSSKRTKEKIPKGSAITAVDSLTKVKSGQEPAFFTYIWNSAASNRGDKVYLPYTTIKGQQYYQIGKNKYINALNVAKIANHQMAVNRPVTLKLSKNAAIYSFNAGEASKTKLKGYKKGQKVVIDYQVTDYYFGESEDHGYYHIKGKGNQFIYGGNIKTRLTMRYYFWHEYETMRTSATVKANQELAVYDLNGKKSDVTLANGTEFNVDQLRYIYLPSENKAELFYHLTDRSIDNNEVGSGFVKASDVTYLKNAKLKAGNTAASAKTDNELATNNQKEHLQTIIADVSKVKKNFSYTEASKNSKAKLDAALTEAEAIVNNDKATKNEVEFAGWYVQKAKEDLDGNMLFS